MRILIVEDSRRLRESLCDGLRQGGYAVDAVGDGREGLIHAQTTQYDLIVLDLMLPVVDGLTVLRTLRKKGIDTHVLILSARDRVEQRVEGLRAGADDYLIKPFSFDELLARIETLTRRSHGRKVNKLSFGKLTIDLHAKQVFIDGEDVALPPREYSLLEYLAIESGRAVPRTEIEEHIYDESGSVWSNAVDSAIASLRRRLVPHGLKGTIVTRRGVGYMFDPESASLHIDKQEQPSEGETP